MCEKPPFSPHTGSHDVPWAGPKFLCSRDPLASASQVAGMIGICHFAYLQKKQDVRFNDVFCFPNVSTESFTAFTTMHQPLWKSFLAELTCMGLPLSAHSEGTEVHSPTQTARTLVSSPEQENHFWSVQLDEGWKVTKNTQRR